jgi:hypothetical protein
VDTDHGGEESPGCVGGSPLSTNRTASAGLCIRIVSEASASGVNAVQSVNCAPDTFGLPPGSGTEGVRTGAPPRGGVDADHAVASDQASGAQLPSRSRLSNGSDASDASDAILVCSSWRQHRIAARTCGDSDGTVAAPLPATRPAADPRRSAWRAGAGRTPTTGSFSWRRAGEVETSLSLFSFAGDLTDPPGPPALLRRRQG